MQVADGLVVVSSPAFEPGSVQVVREWLRGLGDDQRTFEDLEDGPASAPPQHSAEDVKILGFLDDMCTKNAERSVIFVRRPLLSPAHV
jgi:hypothetical protein